MTCPVWWFDGPREARQHAHQPTGVADGRGAGGAEDRRQRTRTLSSERHWPGGAWGPTPGRAGSPATPAALLQPGFGQASAGVGARIGVRLVAVRTPSTGRFKASLPKNRIPPLADLRCIYSSTAVRSRGTWPVTTSQKDVPAEGAPRFLGALVVDGVVIEDVSRIDAPSAVVAEVTQPLTEGIDAGGRLTVELVVPSTDERASYNVRAHIDFSGSGELSSGDRIDSGLPSTHPRHPRSSDAHVVPI